MFELTVRPQELVNALRCLRRSTSDSLSNVRIECGVNFYCSRHWLRERQESVCYLGALRATKCHRTCHRQSTLPLASSLTAAKSLPPWFVSLQLPYAVPTTITEPLPPVAIPHSLSNSELPSCDISVTEDYELYTRSRVF